MNKDNVIAGVRGVVDLFPKPIEKGSAKVDTYTFQASKNPIYNLRAMRDGSPYMRMVDGNYARLYVGGSLVMSDTRMERVTNFEVIDKANGRVLIGGLGLGLLLRNMLEKDEVTEIVVVELSQDVIDIVAPVYTDPRVKILQGDIDEWRPDKDEKFDTIYFDIWNSLSEDNLEHMYRLERAFRKYLNKDNPNRFSCSWSKKEMQSQRRRDRAEQRRWAW